MPKRFRQPPPLSRSAKTSLDPIVLPHIDAALKQLKSCARNLQPVLATFSDELQILQRLYYKGKNEHRSALFWRRVAEMRRYGDRVGELALSSLVDSLRYSFFGEDLQQTSKLLKGSWTHYPDPSFVSFVLERIKASITLVQKMDERLAHAYQTLSLAMQTGAFIQLLLTLTAIASRLSRLVSELEPILGQAQDAVHRILATLGPDHLRGPRLTLHNAIDTSGSVSIEAAEDTGVSIRRQDPDFTDGTSLTAGFPTDIRASSPPAISSVPGKRTMPTELKRLGVAERPMVKKKKRKRDEIDDIFG